MFLAQGHRCGYFSGHKRIRLVACGVVALQRVAALEFVLDSDIFEKKKLNMFMTSLKLIITN